MAFIYRHKIYKDKIYWGGGGEGGGMEAYRYPQIFFSRNIYVTLNVLRLSYVDMQFLSNRDKLSLLRYEKNVLKSYFLCEKFYLAESMMLNAFKYVVIKESRYNLVVIMLKDMSLNPFWIWHYELILSKQYFKILWREQIIFSRREQRKNTDGNKINRYEGLAEVPQKINWTYRILHWL